MIDLINPFNYSSPREVAAAVEAASDEALGPALAALSIMTGRTCTRADLLDLLGHIAEQREN